MEESEIDIKELIVIGVSSGSLMVFFDILNNIPDRFPLAVLLIIHRGNFLESMLLNLLALKSRLPVKEVEEKEKIKPSHVYLAPADYHVLIEKDKTFSLDYSEKLNFSRPSIDISFISAASVYGKKLTGILLSGANNDGAEGLKEIKGRGGHTIIQDPEDAVVNYMPKQAILKSRIDQVLTTEKIKQYLISLSHPGAE
jgi:two-component system chemotaxis response regulator CheB